MKLARRLLFACGIACIVTAVCAATRAADTVSLAGDWRFEVADAKAAPYARNLTGTIHLPGTMDDAGLGPKNASPPTLEGPRRLYNYAGPAWYQRDVEIPNAWQGKRVTLFLERCRWVTTVWLDDKRIQFTDDSLISPHIYRFRHRHCAGQAPTDDLRGQHRRNSISAIFVSALFGGTWGNMNGIVGRHRAGRHTAGVD